MSSTSKKYATKRLLKDWKELEHSKEEDFLSTVSALPTSNIFVWHCNLRPDYGQYAGTIFHLILRFPESYPHDPPDVELCTWISHPNVYNWRTQGYSLCLDMIQKWYTGTPYTGWTSAYSILGLLLQIQSFLFAEYIPQNYGGTARAQTNKGVRERGIQSAKKFKLGPIKSHDGELIFHTHEHPWPPLRPNAGAVRIDMSKEICNAASTTSVPPAYEYLPPDLHVRVFSYLDAKGLIQAQNVCSQWREIVLGYNLFERSQIMCFHTKAKFDDPGTILGIGLNVQYYPDGKMLKTASSPLDILSKDAFFEEKVRTGVWGGINEAFAYFLPLVLNSSHAEMAVNLMEETIHLIMARCDILPNQRYQRHGNQPKHQGKGEETAAVSLSKKFHPLMAFNLLATLMNSMVVELMNAAEKELSVSRFASEKALEGYCSFHHMLLFFAKRYPMIQEYAEKQVYRFLSAYYYRHKRQVPNLGILLVCLTLSRTGWDSLRKPLVMEAFDRNVLWLLKKTPQLESSDLSSADRLSSTFMGARTSLRLLMFQTHFMSRIGRPKTKGKLGSPNIVLDQYNKQLGKPTPDQKNDLQLAAKEILDVTTWPQFFRRLGGPVPSSSRLVEILKDAIANSLRKRYHMPQSERARRAAARAARNRAERDMRDRQEAERVAQINDEFWDERDQATRGRRAEEEQRLVETEALRAAIRPEDFEFF
mmetsp:Transcript_36208/g.67198  ORF Transcript_36208/g.67198 Transcript_36208/m.67198 type:complete len:705 (-) Transcript_36208:1464-3578(-)